MIHISLQFVLTLGQVDYSRIAIVSMMGHTPYLLINITFTDG